jgi:predicted permease
MSWIEGTRARLRLLFARRAADSRVEEEFRFHVEQETERLVRETGVNAAEARRRALVAFGGVEKHKEDLRRDRGLAWLGGMSLDLKLGLRMLAKYPGLTLVGVLGMAVAVAIGAVAFGVIYTIIDPSLPLADGDRIVAIQNVNARSTGEGRETHLHDLATWRQDLSAVEIIGAYRTIDRNLITPRGRPEPVRIAEMSATGFQVARVAPTMGRYFNAEDERPGAPPVVVIGQALWQSRFAGEPDVIGRTLQLGSTSHTVIGVMPPGFAFPINNRIWTPLRLNTADFVRGKAPSIDVFGRLAANATIEDAQTQLTAIGRRLAAAYPETHQQVRPRVLAYPRTFIDAPDLIWAFHLGQLLISMLLVVIGTNVAVLVYARTATRMGEIAVRSALGASRARIVGQLFAEALVLSGTAAAVGLVAAQVGLRQIDALLERQGGEQLPFWMDFGGISVGLVLYVVGLAVLAAVIVGVLPALKATRRDVHANLQQIGAGSAGMRIGKTWTLLIVTQVAVAVACLPVALHGLGRHLLMGMADPGYATSEMLIATLRLDREGDPGADDAVAAGAFATRFATRRADLVRRLEAEARVSQVVVTSAIPGDEPQVRIEAERTTDADTAPGRGALGHQVKVGRVEQDFFEAFDIPILSGRGFRDGDVTEAANAVIVNRSFVRQVLHGGDPLGRRVRRVATDADGRANSQGEPWLEIVGVVPDYPDVPVDPNTLTPKLYQPIGANLIRTGRQRTIEGKIQQELPGQPAPIAGTGEPSVLAIRVRGAEPAALADRLRDLTLAVDPMLRLQEVSTLDEKLHENMEVNRIIAFAVAALTVSVVLLSAAGIYALMSFTITRRRREIGIRSALGAGARSVLWSVLWRAMSQIGIGIVIGVAVMGLMDWATAGEMLGGRGILLLPVVALLMVAVGLAAAVGPARQALLIQPTEALRADG